MPAVAKAIRDELAKDLGALVRQALAMPLDALVSFLAYADRVMPVAAKAICDGLAKDPDALVRQVRATPFDALVSFLAYAGEALPKLREAVQKSLLSEDLLPTMAKQALYNGPIGIAALRKLDKAFAQILIAIDAGAWSLKWSNFAHGPPHWFIGFALSCYSAGRHDLVGTIAEAIIRLAVAEDFTSRGVTVRHLSFLLTSPHECTPAEVETFFVRCLSGDWLARQYESPLASIGSVAGVVRAATMDERVWIRMHFRDPGLARRLHLEWPMEHSSPLHVSDWLQLLSAARLLDPTTMHMKLVETRLIRDALGVVPPGPPGQGIQPMQAGLWAGLREWCHLEQIRPNPGHIRRPGNSSGIPPG
jgi:hypothetical protein